MNSQRGMVAATVGLALLAAVTTSAASVLAAEDACSLNTIRGTYAWEMKGRTFGGGLSSETLPGGIPMLQGTVFPVYMTGEMTVGSDGNAGGRTRGSSASCRWGTQRQFPGRLLSPCAPIARGSCRPQTHSGEPTRTSSSFSTTGARFAPSGLTGRPWPGSSAWCASRAQTKARRCAAPRPHAVDTSWSATASRWNRPGPPPRFAGVSPLFLLDVAADGTVTGLQFARHHPQEGMAVTGMVKIDPDCTGKTTMQTDALPGMTILGKNVYFDNGKEAFGGPILALAGVTPVPGAFAGFGCHMTRLAR